MILTLEGTSSSKISAELVRIRRSLAVVLLASGLILAAINVLRGGTPAPGHVMMLMLAAALYTNSSGRFIRDWTPVVRWTTNSRIGCWFRAMWEDPHCSMSSTREVRAPTHRP